MESTIGRGRNTRTRKRKSSIYNQNKASKIIKQVIISTAIFVIILTAKNIDNSFTSYITNQTINILRTDTEISAVTASIKQMAQGLNISNDKLKSVFNSHLPSETTEQTNQIPVEIQEKIYNGTIPENIKFEAPISGIITSGFGMRINPITKEREFHEGIDIDPLNDENIKSVSDGQIVEVKESNSLGNYIKIKHDENMYSLYAHASSVLVKEGQRIKKGEIIARPGNTGMSSGKHLHFELLKDGKVIDPQKLFTFKSSTDLK